MQKKTKSRLSELFFVFICVCCSCFSVYQFYQSLNRTLVKDEEPIATISFKYKTAQRKFIDDMLWDRLQQDSPVYEGDTIRTAEQSEATLNFVDGNIMELQSNTMIRVNLSDDGTEVDFTSGSISVRTSDDSSMKIRSGNSVVDIAASTSIAAAGGADDEGPLKVAVKDGTASLTSESGTIDLEAGKVTQISSEGTIEEHLLAVHYPEDNFRTLTFSATTCAIPFRWESSGRTVILETSDTKNFDTITSTATYEDTSSAELNMGEGAHWWRMTTVPLSADEEPERITGKVTVLYSPAPTPIAPRLGNNTTFRTKLPQIRLSWSESERATGYRVDIADNQLMNNPVISLKCTTTSTVVTTLSEGTWYWTVTPYYTFDDIGYANTSFKSYFFITRSLELKAPVLQTPESSSIVCTQLPLEDGSINYKTVLFSWKNDPEAANYDLTVWSGNATTPLFTRTVYTNWCSVDTAVDALPKGNITWQVTIRDSEGNTKSSEKRTFYSIDSNVEQRTLNPPDKYRVVTTRSNEIEFRWKTNIPYATTLEVAKDEEFHDIVLSQETTASSVQGRQLPEGTYWWRISATAGSVLISTQPKMLEVEPLLAVPELVEPADKRELVILPNAEHSISWKPVEDADYYQFKLVNTAKPNNAIISRNITEAPQEDTFSIPIDIAELGAGKYTWTVQAFRNETTAVSRSSSPLGSYSFSIRELHPALMGGPEDGTEFAGLQAWLEPASFTWKANGDTISTNVLTLYKDSVATKNVVKTWRNQSSGVKMPQLEEGTYIWTLTAKTREGYDITPVENTKTFTVGPIPALPAPQLDLPADGTVFGVDYLRDNHTIHFAWQPVQDATQYIYTLSTLDGEILQSEVLPPEQTDWLLDDMTILKGGTFLWTLKAERYYEERLLQESEISTAQFDIDLPALALPKIKDFGKRYGL